MIGCFGASALCGALVERTEGGDAMNVLLVSPATPATFWSFRHVLRLASRRSAFPPLGLLTVAAMLPESWDLRLVDLDVGALSDADIAWADWVFLSGMIVQEASCREVVRRCCGARRAGGRRGAAVHDGARAFSGGGARGGGGGGGRDRGVGGATW